MVSALFPSPIFPPVKRELAYMHLQKILNLIHLYANPSGCAVYSMGLWPLTCWDCGFESHQGHGCHLLWVLCVLSGRGLRNGPDTCLEECLNECDWGTLKTTRPTRAAESREKNHLYKKVINLVQFLSRHKKARKFLYWCIVCNHAASTGFTGNNKLAQISSLMTGTA